MTQETLNNAKLWSDGQSILQKFCYLLQWKNAQKLKNFVQTGSKFYQTLNEPTKVCLRVLTFCQSGEISTNLFTLPIGVLESIHIVHFIKYICNAIFLWSRHIGRVGLVKLSLWCKDLFKCFNLGLPFQIQQYLENSIKFYFINSCLKIMNNYLCCREGQIIPGY